MLATSEASGNLTAMLELDVPERDLRRFWSKVALAGDDECWTWIASVGTCGYPQIRWRRTDGTSIVARGHRLAYALTHGREPVEDLLHSCDNRVCVNPAHLHPGDQAENIAEMVQRLRHVRGERVPQSKLTNEEALQIRAEYAGGEMSQRELAHKFRVSQATVSRLVAGETWKLAAHDAQSC